MAGKRFQIWLVAGAALVVFIVLPFKHALAVPSFARQTGTECAACHTVFPELTPLGRSFKLGGYLMSTSKKAYEFPPPLAGMAQVSFSHTDKKQPAARGDTIAEISFQHHDCLGRIIEGFVVGRG